jgi:hypothetical protein
MYIADWGRLHALEGCFEPIAFFFVSPIRCNDRLISSHQQCIGQRCFSVKSEHYRCTHLAIPQRPSQCTRLPPNDTSQPVLPRDILPLLLHSPLQHLHLVTLPVVLRAPLPVIIDFSGAVLDVITEVLALLLRLSQIVNLPSMT